MTHESQVQNSPEPPPQLCQVVSINEPNTAETLPKPKQPKAKYTHAIPEFDPAVIAFAQAGDTQALDAVARGCLPFAQWAARHYLASFPLLQEDAVQVAFVGVPFAYNSKGKSSGKKYGLLQKLKQFDPARGDFQRFAAAEITTAVQALLHWELKHTRDIVKLEAVSSFAGKGSDGDDNGTEHFIDYLTGGYETDYEGSADTVRNATTLRAAFNSLRQEYQQVLTLAHTMPTMTMREIADHLTSAGTPITFQGVHLRYKAAVKELKKLIKQANMKKAA